MSKKLFFTNPDSFIWCKTESGGQWTVKVEIEFDLSATPGASVFELSEATVKFGGASDDAISLDLAASGGVFTYTGEGSFSNEPSGVSCSCRVLSPITTTDGTEDPNLCA